MNMAVLLVEVVRVPLTVKSPVFVQFPVSCVVLVEVPPLAIVIIGHIVEDTV